MARYKSTESAIQTDPVLFEKMKKEINTIGVIVLAEFGLVSRTTIKHYTNGKQVVAETEQAIINSIKRFREEEEAAAKERAAQASELLS